MMNTYIALLRGINVGGHNILPMRDLVGLLEGLGLKQVKTYIQSGNVVFQSDGPDAAELARGISAAIKQAHGFAPQVIVLDLPAFQQALAANPFPAGEAEPKTLHLYFLSAIPTNPDFDLLNRLKADSEQFRLIDAVFYLHAPAGIGRSKLAANVEQALGVPVTARNWRTVSKILATAT